MLEQYLSYNPVRKIKSARITVKLFAILKDWAGVFEIHCIRLQQDPSRLKRR